MSVGRLIKSAVLDHLPSRPRRIPFGLARGMIMEVDFRFDTAFFFGLYEPELNDHYQALVHQSDSCFDVGSHRGWDSLVLAKLNRGAPVLAFDVNPANGAVTERNAALNGAPVHVISAFINDRGGGGALTLDEAAREFFVPDFIKMDIEGAEADALEGARNILAHRKPSLIVEVHGRDVEDRCRHFLEHFGYQPHIVDQKPRWLKERRGTEHNRWLIAVGRPSTPAPR
jgi:Methyltransferase FkbM domain